MDIRLAARARECFDTYRTLEYGKFGGKNDAQAMEASKRLRQLQWIIEKVISLCAHSTEQHLQMMQMLATKPLTDPYYQHHGLAQIELLDQIEIHTETFYWISHRTSAVLREMPGLRSFKAAGARDVRNWLLEHVEKPGGSTTVGFGWGGSNGPMMATNIPGKDKGLYANAGEFFLEVERVTVRCVENSNLIA